MHPCCDCATGQTGKGRRYNLFLPQINCTCGKTWSIGIGDLVESGYWPATVNFETLYAVDLFTTYEDQDHCPWNVTASFCQHARTSDKALRSDMWRHTAESFLEWTYAKFEVEVQHFQCPSCTPSMLAVAVDGNRKLYRFKSQPGNPAKGRCGSGQWSAARETANKSASKLDEEDVEVAVCRHGFLLKGLNMFRGDICAYPLYLQKQLSSRNVQFFCTDVVCKYWPYLQGCEPLSRAAKPFEHASISVHHACQSTFMVV
ncbi:hypothetical protein F7725_017566 [Dissostichus mawsoni]|uniref:CxC3 like cysteine cluster domain-containing protein n=1 Tax=Dissostichus mawsoni TaxID=36200 RepID=A0A7J5Z5M6_DISMA|nr:hypothetical protein F7725_017566 [Dissostichus mawsoni]